MPCISIKFEGLKTRILSSSILAHVQKLQESQRLEFETVLNLWKCWISRWVPKIMCAPEKRAGDPKHGILGRPAQLQQVSTNVMGGDNLHHSYQLTTRHQHQSHSCVESSPLRETHM